MAVGVIIPGADLPVEPTGDIYYTPYGTTGLYLAVAPGILYTADAGTNTATMAITETADTLAWTVATATDSTLTVTEAADTLAGTVTTSSDATLTVTETGDTVVVLVGTASAATLTITEAADVLAFRSTPDYFPLTATTRRRYVLDNRRTYYLDNRRTYRQGP